MARCRARRQRYDRMRREIAALPGVIEVGVGSTMPLRSSRRPLRRQGGRQAARRRRGHAARRVPHGRARTTSAPREFRCSRARVHGDRSRAAPAKVVIINQTLADQLFPGEDPIGKRIAWTGDVLRFTPFSGDWRTVVGVVGNTQDGGLDAAPRRGDVHAVRAGAGDRRRARDPRRQQRRGAATAAATRIVRRIAPAALDRERDDGRADQGSRASRRDG